MSFLRNLFGPSKDEVWRQVAKAVGGSFVPGTMWQGSKVQANHAQWTITLDTYAVSTGKHTAIFTRLRAPYVNP